MFSRLIALALLAAPALAEKPNVILIMADDLGYRDLSCYGHPSIKTPVIDGLAKEGIRLTNFHSGASVCTPSRMALMTGAYPVRLGWTQGVMGYKMGFNDGMNPEALTIAEIFRSEGYATGISGKWHLGNEPATRPHGQGFDETYYISHSNNQTKKLMSADEVLEDPFENRLLTEKFTDAAIRFVREHAESPFFLYLPYSAPHFPVEPHPEWKGKSSFGKYGDVVEEMDHRIGELLAVLEELKIDQRTIVVFTSDNGPQKGEQSTAFPFRGAKWSALEGGTRVPFVMRWPGVVKEGGESDALVSAIDMLPTLCAACGIDWKSKSSGKPVIDGVDVRATLRGSDGKHPRNELLHWQGMSPEPRALVVGDWKLFFDSFDAVSGMGTSLGTKEQLEKAAAYAEGLGKEGENPPMLFQLDEDPGEVVDRSSDEPAKVSEIEKRAEELSSELKSAAVLEVVKGKPGRK
ncbi:arylsulfatase [Haloferula helveola]|uniref:Arylsulfatase n=1 Tax=Haloferula helveola TaxID=490095 RepID=A0ABM7RGP2_9BACT|nr:arylsulfatase [Haloferula helveola]